MTARDEGPSTFNYSDMTFQSSNVHLGNIYGNVTNNYTASSRTDYAVLGRLDPVQDARWDSLKTRERHRSCHAQTRTEVLEQISAWANSESNVFWLAGMAGTGKSTIAMTVTESLTKARWLVGSSFFQRGAVDLAAAIKVIPTLSYQLAARDPSLGGILTSIVQANDAVSSLSLDEQMQHLFTEPLRQLGAASSTSPRMLIVIDALDECNDSELVRRLLAALVKTTNDPSISIKLKILLTSRLDWSIRSFFEHSPLVLHRSLHLDDITRHVVDQDIERYVRNELQILAQRRSLPPSWPPDQMVRTVVKLAAGLFIFAATICRYVNGPKMSSPEQRLAMACRPDARHRTVLATKQLDRMYEMVIEEALAGEYEEEELAQVKNECHRILELLVLSPISITTSAISLLSGISEHRVVETTRALHAVVKITVDGNIQILHESFSDFLLDGRRCLDTSFLLGTATGHDRILGYCLGTMSRLLRWNICELESVGTQRETIPPTRLDIRLSPGLGYACRAWHRHISGADTQLRAGYQVYEFLQAHSLHYIEAMSILDALSQCIVAFATLEAHCTEGRTFRPMLYDLQRFVLEYRHGISLAPLQVYVLASEFSPTSSFVRKFPVPLDSQRGYAMVSQHARYWDGRRHRLGFPGAICDMKFSSNGTVLAVIHLNYANAETISVVETATGETNEIPNGHGELNVAAGAHGGIAGCADGTVVVYYNRLRARVRVWSVLGKTHLLDLEQQYFQAISDDGTILLTKPCHRMLVTAISTSTGSTIHELHTDSVLDFRQCKAVTYRMEKRDSRPDTCVIEVWNLTTAGPCTTLKLPPSSFKDGLRYSATLSKCEKFVLLRRNLVGPGDELYLYDLDTGTRRTIVGGPHIAPILRLRIIQFHFTGAGTDAKILVHQGGDETWEGSWLHIYNLNGEPLPQPARHMANDQTIHVTGDGRYVCVRRRVYRGIKPQPADVYDLVSRRQHSCQSLPPSESLVGCGEKAIIALSRGDLVEIWDVRAEAERKALGTVSATVLSDDASLLVTTSVDRTIRVWDVSSGTLSQETQLKDGIILESNVLEISKDGSAIAFVATGTDSEIWLWNRIQEPYPLAPHPLAQRLRSKTLLRFSPDALKIACKVESESAPSQIRVYGGIGVELPYLDQEFQFEGEYAHVCSDALYYKDQWIYSANAEPIIWLPEGYRPAIRLEPTALWSCSERTLIICSETGRHTFIKLTASVGTTSRKQCSCIAETAQHKKSSAYAEGGPSKKRRADWNYEVVLKRSAWALAGQDPRTRSSTAMEYIAREIDGVDDEHLCSGDYSSWFQDGAKLI